MFNEVKQIKELEKKVIDSRKELIIEKMQYYYEYCGIPNGDLFIKYLEDNTSFICGCCADMEKFKRYYLTSFKRLNDFNEKYYNSGLDESEHYFLGFDGDLKVVNETELYEALYEAIMAYEFNNRELNNFEAMVNINFENCC